MDKPFDPFVLAERVRDLVVAGRVPSASPQRRLRYRGRTGSSGFTLIT